MTEPQTTSRRSIADVLRSLVRQASAAVYIFIAYAVFVLLLKTHPWATQLEPLFVLFGAALVAALVDGPWWTVSFVGVFVALLDGAFLWVTREEGEVAPSQLALTITLPILAGAVGAFLGRWFKPKGSLD